MSAIEEREIAPNECWVVLGAYARISSELGAETRGQVEGLEGVTAFDLGDSGKLGLVIEAVDSDSAHRRLTEEVARVERILGVMC